MSSNNEITAIIASTPLAGLYLETFFYGAYISSLYRHLHALQTRTAPASRRAALIALLCLCTTATADIFLRFSAFYTTRRFESSDVNLLPFFPIFVIFAVQMFLISHPKPAGPFSVPSAQERVSLAWRLIVMTLDVLALAVFPILQLSMSGSDFAIDSIVSYLFVLVVLASLATLELVQLGIVGSALFDIGLYGALRLPSSLGAFAACLVCLVLDNGHTCSVLVTAVLASLLTRGPGSLAPLLSGSCLQTACMALSALFVRVVVLQVDRDRDQAQAESEENGAAPLSIVAIRKDEGGGSSKGFGEDNVQVV